MYIITKSDMRGPSTDLAQKMEMFEITACWGAVPCQKTKLYLKVKITFTIQF